MSGASGALLSQQNHFESHFESHSGFESQPASHEVGCMILFNSVISFDLCSSCAAESQCTDDRNPPTSGRCSWASSNASDLNESLRLVSCECSIQFRDELK